jgi:molybdate transport system permease protein
MLLAILVAVPSGYALSRYPFRGMIVLDVIIDALIVLPVLIIGISVLVFFREGSDLLLPGSHLLDKAKELFSAGGFFSYLGGAGLMLVGYVLVGAGKAVSALGRFFIYHKPGIVLAQFFCAASYAVRVMKATFDEISPRTEQVAMTLGCSRAGAFARVTLPLARHGIVAAAVLSWARAISVYGPVQIVAGAVSGRTLVLPSAIYLEISIGQLKLALAMSILMIVTAFAVLLLMKVFSKSSLFGAGGGE